MTALLTLLLALNAHAYGPASKILTQQNYVCDLHNREGETLHATAQRRLWDILRKPGTRMLISTLHLADGTGFETGTGNLDRLLAPHFGRAAYDESQVDVQLENVTGDESLAMRELESQSKTQKHAWAAESQDDMTISTKIEGGDSPYVEVIFSTTQKHVGFEGQCLQQN